MRKPSFGFWTRSDTNQAVLPQNIARGLRFQIKEAYFEGLHCLCSTDKSVVMVQLILPFFCVCKKLIPHDQAQILQLILKMTKFK